MNSSQQAINTLGLTHLKTTPIFLKQVCLNLLLLVLLFLHAPNQMNASSIEDAGLLETTTTATSNELTINNAGTCEALVYLWLATGDIYKTTIQRGQSWKTTTNKGDMWRVVSDHPNWDIYDQHYTVTANAVQQWNIYPRYCEFSGCSLIANAGEDLYFCQYEGGQNFSASATGGKAPYTYEWSNGLGRGQHKTAGSTSTTAFTVTVTDANGCQAVDEVVLFIDKPSVQTTPDLYFCQYEGGQNFSANATGGKAPYTYEWSNGLGRGQHKTSGSTTTQTFTVTVTDAIGCIATDEITIFVEKPSVETSPDLYFCKFEGGQNFSANATGGTAPYTYEWSNGLGRGQYKTAGSTTTQTFTVTVTDANGCTGTDKITIFITDKDGDGVCDDEDCEPNNPSIPAPVGSPCNDNDPNTINDVIYSDGCSCYGDTKPECYDFGGDKDNDGICANEDCNDNDPNLPLPAGSECDDNNPNTVEDVIGADGCSCRGKVKPACYDFGGDFDGDGICAYDDCNDEDPNLPLPVGSPCNDNDPNTINDVIYSDGCSCYGEDKPECYDFGGDKDNDGICANEDCNDNDPNLPLPAGSECDDNNPNTVEDVIGADGCSCRGKVKPACYDFGGDFDGDGICAYDDCNDEDPNLPLPVGSPCNDNDPNTINDVIYSDGCSCYGEDKPECYDFGGDKDNDGICANEDCNDNDPNLPLPAGSECDDNNPNTVEDVIGADGCSCRGKVKPACYDLGGDFDGDGICAYDDCNDEDPNLPLPVGTACNDNDPNTINDVIYSDGCSCYGEAKPECYDFGGDKDNDGICASEDCNDNDPNLPLPAGSECDDNNPNTVEDVIGADGCSCRGKVKPACYDLGGDFDGDGICAYDDCNDEDPNLPLPVGSPCDDRDPNTINDVIYSDGCSCYGEAKPECYDFGGDTDNDGICANEDCNDNDPNLPAIQGTACDDRNANTINDVILSDGCSCRGEVKSACYDFGGDADNDGVCAYEDCDDNDPSLPARQGTACDDRNPDTQNDVILSDGCSCAGQEIVIPTIGISDVTVNEEDGIAILDICLDQVATEFIYVRYSTMDDAAVAGSDYNSQSSYAFISQGQQCAQITIPLVNDEVEEADEIFKVMLSSPFNAEIADDLGMVTILDTDAPEVIPSVIINDATVNEEAGTATLDICLDQVSDEIVTVRFTTADDSAIAGSDYQVLDGVASINPGQLCTQVTFPILDDATEEATESFIVNLTALSNAIILDGQGTITILDTDQPVKVIPTLSITDVVVNEEDGTAVLDICLDQVATEFVYVRYSTMDDSAIAGTDYVSQASYAFISQGQQCATVTFNILDDNTEEADEIFKVMLSSPFNAEIADDLGMVTILDTDAPEVIPTVIINDVTVNEEAGTATLDICLDQVSDEIVTVRFTTADDSAIAGSDYQVLDGVASINPGQLCTQVTFPILDDATEEATESFIVNLTALSNAIILDGQGTITILDTDQPVKVIPNLSITDVVVNEEDGTAVLDICLDQVATEFIYVRYTTGDGSAVAGSDYVSQSSYAFISQGQQCATVTFNILDDNTQEAEELFTVTLSSPFNAVIADGEGTVTILDTDEPEAIVPVIIIDDVTLYEEEGVASLTISLSQPTTQDVSVIYTTSDASAIDGTDYIGSSTVVTIPAGQTSVLVTFPILDDAAPESTENFVVNLSGAVNGTIADPQGTVTILDQDKVAPVVPTIVIDDVILFEDDGIAILTISLSQVTTQDVTVDYITVNQTAIDGPDYIGLSSSVTIPAGQTSVTVTFPIIDDREDEQDEIFVVNLTNPVNGIIADAQGTVTILDNDDPIVIEPIIPNLSINDVTVNEDEGFAHLQICLDRPATETITLDCVTADGSAIAGADYLQTTDVATISIGQTCTQASFRLVDDKTAEDTEIYFINLSNPSGNVNIVDAQGSITIIDNDDAPINECPEMSITGGVETITVTGLTAPVEIVQIFNASWQVVFQCMNDCNATEIIENLPAGDYFVRINCYNNSWSLLCKEEATVTVTTGSTLPVTGCQGNITNGGRIGGQESICGAYDPNIISTELAPTGGSDATTIEYLWLASTTGCPRELVDQIPGVNTPTYDPGVITETTYFVRCSRRVGCNVWVESNCVVKEVYCPTDNTQEGTNGGTPPAEATGETTACGDVQITYGNGQIEMTGVAGENYFFKVNAVDQGWAVVHGCSTNCGNTQTATDLAPGNYIITIFNANWTQHCQTELVLASSLTSDAIATGRAAVRDLATKATAPMQLEAAKTTDMEDAANTSIDFNNFQEQAVEITLFPNPVVDRLNINLSSLAGQQGTLYLSNHIGQVVKTVSINEIDAAAVQLEVGQLTSGLYHLTIVAEGQLITTKKVIIQQR